MVDGPDTTISLGWAQDWAGPMFDPQSANAGEANQFWYPGAEGRDYRFAWDGPINDIADFSATPGGQGSTYLSEADARLALEAAGVPRLARQRAEERTEQHRHGDCSSRTPSSPSWVCCCSCCSACRSSRRGTGSSRAGGSSLRRRSSQPRNALAVLEVKRVDLVPDQVEGGVFGAVLVAEVVAIGVVGIAAAASRPAGPEPAGLGRHVSGVRPAPRIVSSL